MWEKTFFGLVSLFLVALIGMLRTGLLKEVKRAEEKASTAEKKFDELKLSLQEESKATERTFHELKTTDVAHSMEQKELEKKIRNLDGSFHHQSGDLERRILAYQSQVSHNTSLAKEARSAAIEGRAKAETLERVVSSLLMGRSQEATQQLQETYSQEPTFAAAPKQREEGLTKGLTEEPKEKPKDRPEEGEGQDIAKDDTKGLHG